MELYLSKKILIFI